MWLCGSCFLCHELFHCLKCLYKGENGEAVKESFCLSPVVQQARTFELVHPLSLILFISVPQAESSSPFLSRLNPVCFYLQGSETRHRAQEWRGGIQRQGQEVVWNRVGTRGGRWFLAEASSSWWREFKPPIAFQSPSGQITCNQPSLPCQGSRGKCFWTTLRFDFISIIVMK